MVIGVLEALVIILIAVTVIKLVIFTINSQLWYRFVEKIYAKPVIISVIALVLAGLVLYLLIISGVTILEILAVCLFIALLMIIGFAGYIEDILVWFKSQNTIHIFKRLWLYLLVWFLLLAWGAGEIFLNY